VVEVVVGARVVEVVLGARVVEVVLVVGAVIDDDIPDELGVTTGPELDVRARPAAVPAALTTAMAATSSTTPERPANNVPNLDAMALLLGSLVIMKGDRELRTSRL
jgi:hypothetical protein